MSPLGYTPCFAVANFLDPQVPLCPHNQGRVMSPVCTSLVWVENHEQRGGSRRKPCCCLREDLCTSYCEQPYPLLMVLDVSGAQSCMTCHHSLLTRHLQWRNLSRIIVCHCTIARLPSGVLP